MERCPHFGTANSLALCYRLATLWLRFILVWLIISQYEDQKLPGEKAEDNNETDVSNDASFLKVVCIVNAASCSLFFSISRLIRWSVEMTSKVAVHQCTSKICENRPEMDRMTGWKWLAHSIVGDLLQRSLGRRYSQRAVTLSERTRYSKASLDPTL